VQTLLNNTKHAVCTNHTNGACLLSPPSSRPDPMDATNWGKKLVSGERRMLCSTVGAGVPIVIVPSLAVALEIEIALASAPDPRYAR
jgi:hypothetical protein